MTTYAKESFKNKTIVLDGNSYEECTFDECVLIYEGGNIPELVGCTFENCGWQFSGAAQRTVLFMKALYHGGGESVIEATIEELKKNP